MRFSKSFGRVLAASFALAFAFHAAPSYAVKSTGGEYNTLFAGIGAKGYDVVSYFSEGKPVMGSDKFTSSYGGVTWQFSSKENRDKFAANPVKYAPQFGGFCAWGVGKAGKLFDVDPVNGWTIHEGKLYLNFNGDLNEDFKKNASSILSNAEKNWPGLNK